jgi:hypothetical protein
MQDRIHPFCHKAWANSQVLDLAAILDAATMDTAAPGIRDLDDVLMLRAAVRPVVDSTMCRS